MDNSLDSTTSETEFPVLKSVFKKPTNFNAAFEISFNESTAGTQASRSDTYNNTMLRSNVFKPFEKQRKSLQAFNVSFDESALESFGEQSRMFVKPKSLFTNKQTVDSFNVSFNESTSNPAVSTSFIENSILVKKINPFRQSHKGNNMSIRVEQSENIDPNDHSSFADSDAENIDSTTFVTKQNPFRKSSKDVTDNLEVSGNDSVGSEKNESRIDVDSRSWMSKGNPFQKRKSSQDTSSLSLTQQRDCESSQKSNLTLMHNEVANLSLSVSKSHFDSYANESSINDENLNNWMSDESEDEVSPPEIPPVTKNLSFIKEKQTSPHIEKSQTQIEESQNQKTNWEEKANDIISKAQKKRESQTLGPLKPNPKKVTCTKDQEKKYKPKKLIKPASFATKGLYQFVLKKLKLEHKVDAVLEAEDMVFCICDTVKKVLRRKSYQKSLIRNLKLKMARAGLIETTMEFYEFVITYLPYDFRVKVIPCLQPVSNTVYPPKDVTKPFDKIL